MMGRRSLSDSIEETFPTRDSLLHTAMDVCGFTLSQEPTDSHKTIASMSEFKINLANYLQRHEDYPMVIDTFLSEVIAYFDEKGRLVQSLFPTEGNHSDDSRQTITCSSLVHGLLSVDCLQEKLLGMLFEKLAELSDGDENYMYKNRTVSIPKSLINEFSRLSYIANSKNVVTKVFEVMSVVSDDVQKLIIGCLPEIVNDDQHEDLAEKLKELMDGKPLLTVCVIDTIACLNISSKAVEQLKEMITTLLPSSLPSDTPILVRFLLESENCSSAVINGIRRNLDLTIFPGVTEKEHLSSQLMTVKTILLVLQLRRKVALEWLKTIDGVEARDDLTLLDFVLFLLLHHIGYCKEVLKVMRGKLRCGHFKSRYIKRVFRSLQNILREFFTDLLAIMSNLLCSFELFLSDIGRLLYVSSFVNLDAYCQQEVVGSLVTHAASCVEVQVESSLKTLLEVANKDLKELVKFSIFIKRLVDSMEDFTDLQVHQAYQLLAIVGFGPFAADSHIADELHIILRKQLAGDNVKYKKIGVVGSVMVIRAVCSQEKVARQDYKMCRKLFDCVSDIATRTAAASLLLHAELSLLLQMSYIHPPLLDYISNKIINEFQENYIVELAEKIPRTIVACSPQYGIDEDCAISINLTPMVSQDLQRSSVCQSATEKRVWSCCLASHFRLLQQCERKKNEGILENIDGVLNCAIYLPDPDAIATFGKLSEREKTAICDSLLQAHNFFAEMVNAFSQSKSQAYLEKVAIRLQNLLQVRKQLARILKLHPVYIPMGMPDFHPPSLKVTKKKKNAKSAKGKKRKVDGTRAEGLLDGEESTNVTAEVEEAPSEGDSDSVDLMQYAACFREFDLSALKLIRTTQQSSSGSPDCLLFFVEDLCLKVEHSLPMNVTKRRSFLKKKSSGTSFQQLDLMRPEAVALFCIKLMPNLCSHLEATSSYFQTLIESQDGILDGAIFSDPKNKQFVRLSELLFRSIYSLISWSGYEEHPDLIEKFTKSLSKRLNDEDQDTSVIYLKNFGETVISLDGAVWLSKLIAVVIDKLGKTTNRLQFLESTVEKFLKREWSACKVLPQYKQNVQHLLRLYLEQVESPLNILQSLSTEAMREYVEGRGDSGGMACLNKKTFGLFYAGMLSSLSIQVSKLKISTKRFTEKEQSELFMQWNVAICIFSILVAAIKNFDAPSNIFSLLKYGTNFMELFLSHCMPLLDLVFRGQFENVQLMLKNVQHSTRTLQHVCGHSKIKRNMQLTRLVPRTRKVLEVFVFRVKAMLTLNKCQDAFWVGNLKNRDLQGQEIQPLSTPSDEEDDASDEEVMNLQENDEEDVEEPAMELSDCY